MSKKRGKVQMQRRQPRVIVEEKIDDLGLLVPLKSHQTAQQRAYEVGYRDGMQDTLQMWEKFNQNNTEYVRALARLVDAISSLRELAYGRRAGLNSGYYLDMLEKKSALLAASTADYLNTAAILTNEATPDETPLLELVMQLQNAIRELLAGGDDRLIDIFDKHQNRELWQEALENVDRGGRPAGLSDHREYIGRRALELKKQVSKTTNDRLGMRIFNELNKIKESDQTDQQKKVLIALSAHQYELNGKTYWHKRDLSKYISKAMKDVEKN